MVEKMRVEAAAMDRSGRVSEDFLRQLAGWGLTTAERVRRIARAAGRSGRGAEETKKRTGGISFGGSLLVSCVLFRDVRPNQGELQTGQGFLQDRANRLPGIPSVRDDAIDLLFAQ